MMTPPFFPLFWMNGHVAIMRYDKEYLTLNNERNVLLLRNFELIDSCTMIKLWLESEKHFAIYLGKF